jgi:hypothetical protein
MAQLALVQPFFGSEQILRDKQTRELWASPLPCPAQPRTRAWSSLLIRTQANRPGLTDTLHLRRVGKRGKSRSLGLNLEEQEFILAWFCHQVAGQPSLPTEPQFPLMSNEEVGLLSDKKPG